MRRVLEERPRYALACALAAAALLAVVVLIATSPGGEASRPTAGPGERVVSERHLQRLVTDARARKAENTRLRRELRSTRRLAERRREHLVALTKRQQRRSGDLRRELRSTRRLAERRRERLVALSKANKRRPSRRQDRRRSR